MGKSALIRTVHSAFHEFAPTLPCARPTQPPDCQSENCRNDPWKGGNLFTRVAARRADFPGAFAVWHGPCKSIGQNAASDHIRRRKMSLIKMLTRKAVSAKPQDSLAE